MTTKLYKSNFILTLLIILLFTARINTEENVFLHCLPDAMKVKFVTTTPFYGKIFTYEAAIPCEIYGTGDLETYFSIPIGSIDNNCNVIEEAPDKFSTIIVIQHHPMLQQQGDRRLKLNCDFQITNQTVSSAFNTIVDHVRGGRVINSTAPSPKVRFRVLDKRGIDVSDTKLGQELFLRVEIDNNSIFALAPRGLIASSGSTSEHIELLDDMGCPVDNVIFSGLETHYEKHFLQGRFQAFKFVNDVIVRFHLNVQFCVNECPPVRCYSAKEKRKRRHNDIYWNSRPQVATNSMTDPLLPLQKEIMVDGATVTNLPYPKTSSSTIVDSDEEFLCLSKTVFIIILVSLIVLQICITTTCAICIWVTRKYQTTKDSAEEDGDSSVFQGPTSQDTISIGSSDAEDEDSRNRNGFYPNRLRTRL